MYNNLTNRFKIFVFYNLFTCTGDKQHLNAKKLKVKKVKKNPFDNVPNGYSIINIKLILQR